MPFCVRAGTSTTTILEEKTPTRELRDTLDTVLPGLMVLFFPLTVGLAPLTTLSFPLTMAFERAGEVLPAILALDEDGYETATDKKRKSVTSAGFHGPELLRDEKGPVFFAKDGDQRLKAFVTVQTIRNR